MPKLYTQDVCNAQAKILKIDQVLPACTVPKHPLHVVLQLVLAV